MSNITIVINTDNAAFESGNDEVVRILRETAKRLEVGELLPLRLRDVNGNVVGAVEWSDT